MACRALTESGGRCRKMVEGVGLCDMHYGRSAIGPAGVVLLKPRPNANWAERLIRAGVPVRERSAERERQLDAQHAQQAAETHRSDTRYREKPDSGVPVFGRDGITSVCVHPIWNELCNMGYRCTDVHMFRKEGETMYNLVMQFCRVGKAVELPAEAWSLLHDFLNVMWGFVHVWSNPPRPSDALRVDTIVPAHRKPDEQSARRLVFDHGCWNIT